MAWDPAQYLKFAGPRLRPALDLLQRIAVEAPDVVYDLGAGAGNVTRLIAARWPEAQVVGVDSSAEMLARAAVENPGIAPGIEWQRADLASWRPSRPADVIYSNAALHWLDNHDTLLVALLDGLKPGGVLAVQMPRNFGAPSHTSITETALDGPWRPVLEPLLRPSPVADAKSDAAHSPHAVPVARMPIGVRTIRSPMASHSDRRPCAGAAPSAPTEACAGLSLRRARSVRCTKATTPDVTRASASPATVTWPIIIAGTAMASG